MSHLYVNLGTLEEFNKHFGTPPDVSRPEAQSLQWQQLCQVLVSERDSLSQTCTKLQQENEELRRALFHLLDKEVKPEDFDFSADEVQGMSGRGQSFKELIEQRFRD